MRRRSIAVSFAALLCLGACGDDQSSATAATPGPISSTVTTSTTTAATTSTTSTTSSTTSTSSTTTSTTSTTTTVADTLPNPEAVPADPRAAEPLVQLGTIEIPKIGVSKPFYEGITLTTLDHGPGHWPGTAMPGQQGNVVVAGHRVSHDKPFRHLEQLEPGDDVIFTTDAGQFVYKVTSTEVVYPSAVWIADQTPDYTATLFACHPAGSTKQRIVVHLVYAPNG